MSMKTERLNARIGRNAKTVFTGICDEMGLSTSRATKPSAKTAINHGGIPFELRVAQPNEVTAAAIKELIEGKGHKVGSVKDMLNELTEGKANNV